MHKKKTIGTTYTSKILRPLIKISKGVWFDMAKS